MSERTTFVSFLLDETGSMQSIADATVEGFNAYLATLRESDADIVFSLVTFNSNETKRRYVAEPIAEVKPLEPGEYRPDAMTPLIDAAVKIIKATAEAVAHRGDDPDVVIVMQTDGLENVSVEYTHSDLAALIKEKTAAGWEFVFLGAGIDAFAAARRAGMDLHPEQVVAYSRQRTQAVFEETAKNVAEFAELGDSASLSYTSAQRERVGDEQTDKHLRGGAARPARRGAGQSRGTRKRSTVEDLDLTNR